MIHNLNKKYVFVWSSMHGGTMSGGGGGNWQKDPLEVQLFTERTSLLHGILCGI